ncbi:MAG: carboxypeptidase-like regulatory domain-containing protein [Myxococcota bacterium]
MPVHVTPPVSGQVLDAASEAPIAGAVVVLRYDASHGELLPDRDLLGHREVVTDENGRFRVSRATTPGLNAWPVVRTEARVVGVMKDGYLCGSPRGVTASGRVVLRLERAADPETRRASCRPVAARPSEAPEYLAAWRALYPRDGRAGRMVDERQLDRLLEARRVFGPGENCRGPAVDLALAPSGERVGLVLEKDGRRVVEVVELSGVPTRVARIAVDPVPELRPRRLAWVSATELVLWEPASALDRTLSPALLGDAGSPPERVWLGAASPASRSAVPDSVRPRPIEPSDLNDEGDSRWNGRSFRVVRDLDPVTGRGSDALRIERPGGQASTLPLPGEACGPAGQYGRPHFRITADGEVGLDLRHVDGGCHAVAIHLVTGEWRRIDGSRDAAVCHESRRLPLPHMRAAMRGYVRDLEEALSAAGGDPGAAYTLRIARDGSTRLEARDLLGERLTLVVAPFPIETPLSRIDVTAVANAGEGTAAPDEPRLKPL